MDKYDDTYEAVVHMAKVKMVMNAHKGDIEDNTPNDLIIMAKDELRELEEAIGSGDYMDIIEEVADVLNMTIAAAHQAMGRYRTRKHVDVRRDIGVGG